MLLLCPYVRYGYVESEDPPVHGLNEIGQPRLQSCTLLASLAANPKGKLRDDNRARVALILMLLQPGDDARIARFLCRLTEDVRIEQPAHSLRRFGYSRRRGGRSSIFTGHRFQDPEPIGILGDATKDDRILLGIELRFEMVARLGWCETGRNSQASLAVEMIAKFLRELVPVCLLHDNDDIALFEQLRAERVFCLRVQTGRCDFKARPIREHALGSRTAESH